MPTNTATLKTFAQQTRAKLISLITTKLQFVLGQDTAELRGYEKELEVLRKEIQSKGENNVIEEVAFTWFNRVMALRFMDANGYNTPMTVSPAAGQTRPEVLQDAMGGAVGDELHLSSEDKLLPEAKLYRRLLVAICNQKYTEMPFLFERISDYTELLLPDDLLSDQSFVSDIRNGMTDEDCQNVEIMGWLYQFYIIDRKDDAEKKKAKKGGLNSGEQAAATQLFTPHWVVRYMVENSLGRIWMTLHPESQLIKEMLYYIPTPEGQTDTIPEDVKSVADIRFIDPCMGSGHVLVYAFDLLTKMYEEEGTQSREIPTLILTNNIFGIDIDRRCYQLASFALTMKARGYYSRYLRRAVTPNVIALRNIDQDTIESAGNWDAKSSMWQFENVDTIGSLLQISAEDCVKIKVESGLFGEQQRLLKTQAKYLSRKYHCVVTNPPYLGKGFCDVLKEYIFHNYPNSKYDTMATFIERCLEYCVDNGKMGMINMHAWMFISSYERLRKNIIYNFNIDSLLNLGTHAFEEIGGEVVQSVTFILAKHLPKKKSSIYYRLIEGNSTNKENKYLSKKNRFLNVNQKDFTNIPGTPIGYWMQNWFRLFGKGTIGNVVDVKAGVVTGNDKYFVRYWPEVSFQDISFIAKPFGAYAKWHNFQKGGTPRKYYGNFDMLIRLKDLYVTDCVNISVRRGDKDFYFKEAVGWSQIGGGTKTFRIIKNSVCGTATPTVYSNTSLGNEYICGLLNSKVSAQLYPLYNPTINLLTTDISKIPLIECNIEHITNTVSQNISISRLDWDAHETSWDFQTNDLLTINETNCLDIFKEYSNATGICIDPAMPAPESLEWRMDLYKMKWTAKYLQLHANEEELNRQFIKIYGLQNELTPDVPLSEITILQKGEITIENNEIVWHEDVIIKQLTSYLIGCFMGRYSIDNPGIIIASQHQDLSTLGLKVEGIENDATGRLAIDNDGIIPIIEEEDFFADDMTQRIEQAIKIIFGFENFHQNMKYINDQLGKPLREYLFKDFYTDHIDGKMYQKRPIYWLFSSKMGEKKKKGYFKALVYMHRLEPDTLSKLHADYVHPYLNKIEQQLSEAEDQTRRDDLAQVQRNKALKEVEEMRDKVREVHAFELQLVEMASHRLSIDLDDGVKANYPKYYPLVEPIKGLENNED